MKIFNQKTVIGLFDRDEDVENVMSMLQERGFGEENDDEIRLIDQHRLPQETAIEAPEQLAIPQPGQDPISGTSGTAFNPVKDAGVETEAIQNTIHNMLTGLGLNEEEARFHAMHVARGNSMIIVDTNKERAAAAADIMKQVNGVISEA